MASRSPPAKRIKTEVKTEVNNQDLPPPSKFSPGDKVYKGGLPQVVKTTLFEIEDAHYSEVKGWAYTVKNRGFLGDGCTMCVPENQLFTVKHKVGQQFKEEVLGSHATTEATSEIRDWNFVDGKVVYDLAFTGSIHRLDKVQDALKIGKLGQVVISYSSSSVQNPNRKTTYVTTTFYVKVAKATEDQLGTPLT